MSPFDGFANLHPFFVHAPLVFIPTAAAMVWLGRAIRKEGFDTATLLVTLAGATGAIIALATGLQAASSAEAPALAEFVYKHKTNGIALTVVTTIATLVSLAEWRGWLTKKAWWLKGALLTWAAIGTVFSGHNGAVLVYRHGVAVQAPMAAR
jgi:uncharacterized membrane protein